MDDISIPWVDGDWVAASDRALEYRNRQARSSWADPGKRPWLVRSVNMQTWENDPLRAKRRPLWSFERVSSLNRKVWWFREPELGRDLSAGEQYFEMPFLTQHYFQTYLFLFAEACVSDFVRKHNGTQVRETDTLEVDQWTSHLKKLQLPKNEYSAVQRKIKIAIGLLRNKAVHRKPLDIDELWLSMRLPELLEDWHRAFEIQQVFQFVLEDPQMEAETKKEVDRLLFGPKPPPATLLQAHTSLQHSLEDVCFRFVRREYPEMLERRDSEWPEQCELEEGWTNALSAIPFHDDFFDFHDDPLDPEECPSEESQLFWHRGLRGEVLHIARRLRDAASHRNCLTLTSMRKYALNGILLAIMVGDREQAIDIEATIEAFLSGQTKYKVLTRLREACTHDRPIHVNQLGERRKHEALGTYLGDKEVCVREVKPQFILRSPAEVLAQQIKDSSDSAQPFSVEDDGNDGHNHGRAREALSALWESAVHKFVIGDSMHELLGRTEDLWVAGRTNQAAGQRTERGRWSDK